ncbi:hypothetical protein C8Q77DRAFT_1138999 [Trametes polyzona]|nr:hypothetical protein C8Q77DRAFT_1138999 [Trametes polyzona]
MSWLPLLLAYTVFGPSLWTVVAGRSPGNATCASSQLDWYTDVVGETPCTTYQRLRSICNPDFEVPVMRDTTPGDFCDDQVSACCCNSISWALSMLCFNCQTAGPGGDIGIDAGAGAYRMYTHSCGTPLNKTLPTDIQTAVCNKDIKLDRNLYSLFWGDGQWFYIYTKQTMSLDFAVTNNNTFTHCNSTLKGSTTPSSQPPLPSSTSPSASGLPAGSTGTDEPKTASSVAPIVGGAVGGALVALALVALGFIILRKHRRRQGPAPLDLSKEYGGRGTPYTDDQQMGGITPFSVTSAQSNSGYGGGKPPSEEFALLPRGMISPPDGEKSTAPWESSHSLADEPQRHADGGPLPALQRSASGRLPPAYRQSWDPSDTPPFDVPGYGEEPGESEVGAGTAAGSSGSEGRTEAALTAPLYGRDVKRPPLRPSS